MRKYYILGPLLILAVAAFLFFQKEQTYTKPVTGENIIVFGDSLAAGHGSTSENDIASLLSKKTGLRIINAGVNGDTTVSAITRLEADVIDKNPKVVIILLGGNDFFRRIDREITLQSIRTIVERIQKTGAGVILINENKIVGTTSGFRNLASEKQIPYIENIMDGVIGDKQLMSDEIHPNDRGYEIIADKILPVLLDYLK